MAWFSKFISKGLELNEKMSTEEPIASSNLNEMSYIKSERGGKVMFRRGHEYHKKRICKNGAFHWCCVNKNKKCRGRIIMNGDTIKNEFPHSCKPDFIGIEVKKIKYLCKIQAEETDEPLNNIYNNHFSKIIDNEIIRRFPSFKCMIHWLYKARKRKKTLMNKANDPKSTEPNEDDEDSNATPEPLEPWCDAVFIQDAKMDDITSQLIEVPVKNIEFLLCQHMDEEKQISVFCHEHYKEALDNTSIFFIDAFFKSDMSPFEQIMTVHGDIGEVAEPNIVPLLLVLMSSYDNKTYKKLFKMIKTYLPNWNPIILYVDNIDVINVIQYVYPSVKITGTFYNYSKSLWYQAELLGLLNSRHKKKHVALCIALSCIPLEKVGEGWLYIMSDSPQDCDIITEFNNIFAQQWLYDKKLRVRFNFYNQNNLTKNILKTWHWKLQNFLDNNPYWNESILVNFFNSTIPLDVFMDTFNEDIDSNERDERINAISKQYEDGEITVGHMLEKLSVYM